VEYRKAWEIQTAKLAKKKKPPTPEAAVLKAIVQVLNHWKVGHVIRVNTGMVRTGEHGERFLRFGEVGHSDLLVELKDGRNLYVEVKRPGGRLTEAQQAFLSRQIARGCPACCVDSVADLQAYLIQVGLI
jgi:hypothetical protein